MRILIAALFSSFAVTSFAKLANVSLPVDDDTCRAIFLKEMARKCEELSLETAYFENASGLTRKSRISVSDLTKIALAAVKEPRLMKIWAEIEAEIEITGKNPRKEKIVHAYKSYMKTFDEFTKKYKFLGGKGGSLYYNAPVLTTRTHVLVTELNGEKILITLASVKYYKDLLGFDAEILKIADSMMKGEEIPFSETLKGLEDEGGAFEFVTLTGKKISYKSKYADVPHVPASTTKIVTALCMLDHIKDLSAKLTVRQTDIVGGSGFKCFAGDELTYEDALRGLMLPSSNTMANAIASNVGALILESRLKGLE